MDTPQATPSVESADEVCLSYASARMTKAQRRRGVVWAVVVFCLLLAAAVFLVPQFAGPGRSSRPRQQSTERLVIYNLGTPLELYRMHAGRYPTTDEGLAALIERPIDPNVATGWDGPYVKQEELADSWGNALFYRCPGMHNQTGYDLWSAGTNGIDGDADDITNW